MSRRVWTKPFVKTILSGDQRKAGSLERKARSYVGYLFDQMGDKQKHRAGNWNLKDGSNITAFIWNDVLGERALVRIFAPIVKNIPYISMFASGMWEGRSSDPYTDGYFRRVAYYDPNKGDKAIWYENWTKTFNALTYIAGTTSEYFTYPVAEGESRLYTSCSGGNLANWRPPKDAMAMEHTGEMRKVVQLLMGYNYPVIYNHCPEKTHGIYTAEDNSKWVIEISTVDGITAWELPRVSNSSIPELNYMPLVVTTFPLLADRRLLLPASSLATYAEQYTVGYPAGNTLGWAFNSTGTKARNIRSDIEEGGVVPDDYISWKTFLYEISIMGNSTGPTSASISLLDSDYWWTANHSRFHAKIPYSGAEYSLYPSYLSYSGSARPPGNDFRAPVFTFFDDNDQAITVYFRNIAPITYSVSDPNTPYRSATTPGDFGVYENGTYYCSGLDRWEIEGMGRQGDALQTEGLIIALPTRTTLEAEEIINGQLIYPGGVLGTCYYHSFEKTTYKSNSAAFFDVLLIPQGNRTAFYLAEATGGNSGNNALESYTFKEHFKSGWGTHKYGGLYDEFASCGWPGNVGWKIYESNYTEETLETFSYIPYASSFGPNSGGTSTYPFYYWCKDDDLPPVADDEYSTEVLAGPISDRIILAYYSGDTAKNQILMDEGYNILEDTTGLFTFLVNRELYTEGRLFNQIDAFSGWGRISNAPNPDQSFGYTYLGNPLSRYPMEDITVLNVGFFGIPFLDLN